MADLFSIPLVLHARKPGKLVYGLPRWYRPVMAGILALLLAGLALADGRPGWLAWLVLGLLTLALLYQETWEIDAARRCRCTGWGLFLPRSRPGSTFPPSNGSAWFPM